MKTKILVNRNMIAQNKKEGTKLPVISVKSPKSKNAYYSDTVNILDKDNNVVATIFYRPDKPLSCGASVWIEAKHTVTMNNPRSFEELKK